MSVTGASAVGSTNVDASPLAFARVPELIRRHFAGILVALALAAILVLPRWWVIASEPDAGVRVPITPYGAGTIGYDESLYVASIRAAYDGAFPVSSPYLVNHDDGVPQRNALPHYTIAALGRVTGDLFSSLALVTTVGAAAALLLLYVLLLQLTRSRLAAVTLIPLILAVVYVVNEAEGILPLRHSYVYLPLRELDPEREVHIWTRFPAPILGLAPFFMLVIALPRALEREGRWWMAIAAVSLAVLVYTYVYYWTAAGLAMAMLLAALLLRRQTTEALRLSIVGVVALVIAIPELIVLGASVFGLPVDARDRVGLESLGIDTSMGVTILQRLLVGLPFLVALPYRKSSSVFYAALFVSPLILVGVTGLVPQQWHYHTQVWTAFAIPAVAAGGAALVDRLGSYRGLSLRRVAAVGLGIGAVAAFAAIAILQLRAIRDTDDAFAMPDDEHALFSWIRANVGSDETIVTPSITSNLLLAGLTPAGQYLAEGGFSVAKNHELTERLLRAQAAYGYSEEDVFGRLRIDGVDKGFPLNHSNSSSKLHERDLEDYLAFYSFSFEISNQDAFAENVEAWRPRYRELLATDGVLGAYPADYIYCGHRERFFAGMAAAADTWVVPAYERGDYALYDVVDPGTPGAVEFTGCDAP